MPSSIILSDNGVTSGTQGIKSTGGDDGALVLQTTTSGGTPTTALTISNTQTATFAGGVVFPAGAVGTPAITTSGDPNTGIYFPAADQVAITTNGTERVEFGNSETVFNDGGANVDFRVEGDTDANLLFVDASTDWVFVGGTANLDSNKLNVLGAKTLSAGIPQAQLAIGDTTTLNTGTGGGVAFLAKYNANDLTTMGSIEGVRENATSGNYAGALVFKTRTNGSDNFEHARITSGGNLLVGTTASPINDNVVGTLIGGGTVQTTANGQIVMYVNRKTNDGDVIAIQHDSISEGSISVSGNTVSYNGFSGGHWTQLTEGRGYNPDIPRGTVMSTIGEMCEWKSVEWTETTEHPAIPAVEAKEAALDEEGNVIEPAVEAVEGKDAWTETFNKRESYLGDLPVGATFEEDGFTKTVVDDGNERLPKVKISDVVGDKAVYGVFQTWDEVQDMLVTSLGAFVVRIAAGVTVEIGDLLESNGDGCAKVQDDDVIRSKTIAKVTSTTPTATYDDGSYTVPAVIYCG